ncbi:MAG: NAD-dependent epimerase/dehydratase family protein [Candidatus Methanomethylophilaceae archaeon]
MKALVTGGSGFIGRHLTDRLLKDGWNVVSADRDPDRRPKSGRFRPVSIDVADVDGLAKIGNGCDAVFHLAANTDVRPKDELAAVEFEQTFLTTRSVLECMRANGIGRLFFSSSSAVYGNREGLLREDMGDLRPVSYYGAYKLASESLIKAYSSMNGIDALIFRLPNVVGPEMTHGVVFDFMNKIRDDPEKLEILGDGKQEKQYAHVSDIVDGITCFFGRNRGVEVYNISNDSSITVNGIADIVCEEMGVGPEYVYTGGSVGWEGDVPRYMFDISKARAKGWTFRYDSESAVREAVRAELARL